MALTDTEQIRSVIEKSAHILISFPKNYSFDAPASAAALYLWLKAQNKLVDIACDSFIAPSELGFVPHLDVVQSKLKNLQKFVITVPVAETGIDQLSYDVADNNLTIYLTPKTGSFDPQKIKASNSPYQYDLIITLDSPDLESLGDIYTRHTEFFYDTTIINIDHHPENEQFGQINATNMNAVATAEVLFELLTTLKPGSLTPDIATSLLAGLIAKTHSFKAANVTPKTLEIASNLMNAQADRELIIKSLYRSRTLSTLNLWGRVLTGLKSEKNNTLVWSVLTEHDFLEARATSEELPSVVDELISFIPGIRAAMIIFQMKGETKVFMRTFKGANALYLLSVFEPTGSKNMATCSLKEKTLPDAEQVVVATVNAKLQEASPSSV